MSKSGIGKFFRRVFNIVVFLLLVGGWGLLATALHVIVVPPAEPVESTGDGVVATVTDAWNGFRLVVIPKNRLGLSGTYADTRDWTADDLAANEAIVRRLTDTGKLDMIAHVGENTVGDVLDDVLPAAEK